MVCLTSFVDHTQNICIYLNLYHHSDKLVMMCDYRFMS